MIENFKDILTNKYADFEGRARRSEYWYFTLIYMILILLFGFFSGVLFSIVSVMTGGPATSTGMIPIILLSIIMLGLFIPALALTVRRLHDTNKSGWWLLLGFIPFGSLVLFIFYCIEGTHGPNDFGPDPKMTEDNIIDHLV